MALSKFRNGDCMKLHASLWFAAILTAAGAFAQEQPQTAPPTPTPPTVIKTETRLVLVDAVVTDKKGAYIHDLTQKDFKVWEDNKEQTVKTFSFEADAAGPQKDQKRYLVLFFDNANMAIADQARAREAAGKFIDANAGPNRLIAIADYSGTLRIVQNFTEDADRLHQVVKDTKLAMGPSLSGPGSGGLGRVGYDYGVRTSLLALRSLAKNLTDVPGRKSLIFFTSGFRMNAETQSELTATISDCNRANVAVYPIDVRGLTTTTDPMGAPLGMPGGRGGRGRSELNSPSPQRFGGARIFMASFAPDPQRGGTTTGGTTTGGTSGGGSVSSGGSTGGGRPSGGSGGGATGGSTGGVSRGTGPTGSPSIGRSPSGTTGSTGGSSGSRTGGGGTGNMNRTNPYRNNPYGNGRDLLGTFPAFAGDNQQALYVLAEGTGGFVILNTNDLLGGLEKIGKEQNEYYLIGYTPSDSPEGSCHVLKVKVDKGYQVRARSGYCNVKQVDLLAGKPVEKDLETRAAANEAGTINAPLRAPYFFTGPNTARVDVAMEIPSNSVKFTKVKGKQHAEVNILGIAYKPDGQVGARFSDTVKLDMEDKKQIEEFTKRPMHYDSQFDVASGQYTLKVVFSSGGEGFGKLELPLTIDAYDGKQFALSAVALSKERHLVTDAEAGLDSALLEGRTPLIASGVQITPTGSDRFRKTDTASCYLELYEPLNMGDKLAAVGVQLRVLDRKTGEVKGDSGLMEVTNQSKLGNPVVPVALRLPVNTFPVGAYKAEFIAKDGAGKSATRTVDFDVIE
jgi:VWFA-related protein